MIMFDTDIVSDYFFGAAGIVARISRLNPTDFFLPIVGVEEMIRGRLDVIRQSQAQNASIPVDVAYYLFSNTLGDLQKFRFLPYSATAHEFFVSWRKSKIRASSQDLRIAAIAVAHQATLVTRNRRDFEVVPGLSLDVWN